MGTNGSCGWNLPYCLILNNIVLYCTIQYCIVQYFTVLYCIVPCTVFHDYSIHGYTAQCTCVLILLYCTIHSITITIIHTLWYYNECSALCSVQYSVHTVVFSVYCTALHCALYTVLCIVLYMVLQLL